MASSFFLALAISKSLWLEAVNRPTSYRGIQTDSLVVPVINPENSHLENGHPTRYSDRMSIYRAIAAPSRHLRGEPRPPSPANPPLTAAPIPSLPTSQPTHSRRPLPSAASFPPRSPFVVQVMSVISVDSVISTPAQHLLTLPPTSSSRPAGQLSLSVSCPMGCRDHWASLQVHCCKQLQLSVA